VGFWARKSAMMVRLAVELIPSRAMLGSADARTSMLMVNR